MVAKRQGDCRCRIIPRGVFFGLRNCTRILASKNTGDAPKYAQGTYGCPVPQCKTYTGTESEYWSRGSHSPRHDSRIPSPPYLGKEIGSRSEQFWLSPTAPVLVVDDVAALEAISQAPGNTADRLGKKMTSSWKEEKPVKYTRHHCFGWEAKVKQG
jgi:hypothetical protein